MKATLESIGVLFSVLSNEAVKCSRPRPNPLDQSQNFGLEAEANASQKVKVGAEAQANVTARGQNCVLLPVPRDITVSSC